MKRIFVTGIDTDAGKTVASAILCKALEADYWKPVQSGIEEGTDSETVRKLLPDHSGTFHPESIRLKAPLSPHAAAQIEGRKAGLDLVTRPNTIRTLVIEGAGGLLVPLNESEVMADLIESGDHVILVSRNYLGSINHTLLSVAWLNTRGISPGILFNGPRTPSTEEVIPHFGEMVVLGNIDETTQVSPEFIEGQARKLEKRLKEWMKD